MVDLTRWEFTGVSGRRVNGVQQTRMALSEENFIRDPDRRREHDRFYFAHAYAHGQVHGELALNLMAFPTDPSVNSASKLSSKLLSKKKRDLKGSRSLYRLLLNLY